MALPWVRLDSHIGSHDKVLALSSDPSAKRYQALFSYVCALGWSADHGTDGRIPAAALPFVHGNTSTARLLVKYQLWEEKTGAWEIRNFADRQMLSTVVAGARASKRSAAEKGNCKRWHEATCWEDGRGCGRV
jgi:hypothetical protein